MIKANVPLAFRIRVELGDGQIYPGKETVQSMNLLLGDIKDRIDFSLRSEYYKTNLYQWFLLLEYVTVIANRSTKK